MIAERKQELMRDLVRSIKRFQDAVDLFDAVAASHLKINSTDLRCLTILNDQGPLLTNKVAQALGLTKGATTTALNRLEEIGYIKRCTNADDGRSFRIELTPKGQKEIIAVWKPMRVNGQQHMETYSANQLQLLIHFFTQSIELQQDCVAILNASTVDAIDQ